VAGLAFLPWEKWLARLIHPIYVAMRRRLHQVRRKRCLAGSETWSLAEGTIQEIKWDSSLPREEVVYCYTAEGEYYSGSYWHWFDPSNVGQVRVGDRITLRYNAVQRENSVFLGPVETERM
jgi:hypothetical protein